MYSAESFLRKRYTEDISVGDAIHRAIRIIKEGYEGEMTEDNSEIGIIRDGEKFTLLDQEKIRDHLEEV